MKESQINFLYNLNGTSCSKFQDQSNMFSHLIPWNHCYLNDVIQVGFIKKLTFGMTLA